VAAFGFRSIHLDDQQGGDIGGIADLDEGLGGDHGVAVHHLHAGGDDPGADDVGHALAAGLDAAEADQQRPRGFRRGQQAHRHLDHHAQQALRPNDKAEQVVSRPVQRLTAQANGLAGEQDHLHAQHIVGGQAVFQAVHPAGILRHIAADGAGDLAGRVRRVIEAAPLHGPGDGQVGDPRLDHRQPVLVVDG